MDFLFHHLGLVTVLVLPMAALGIARLTRFMKGQQARWREQGLELGLHPIQRRLMRGYLPNLGGVIDGNRVTVTRADRSGDFVFAENMVNVIRVTVEIAGLPADLHVEAGVFVLRANADTGDPAFDRAARVSGSEVHTRALLGDHARAALVHAKAHVDKRVLSIDVPGNVATGPRNAVLKTLAVARALSGTTLRSEDRLRINAVDDAHPEVRRRCRATLVRHFPHGAAARDALEQALSEVASEDRLFAAEHLGPRGHATLVSLAQDPRVADEVRIAAVRAAARVLPASTVEPLLLAALESHRPLLVQAAAAELARFPGASVRTRLVALLAGADDESAPGLARALGSLGDPEAEPALLAILERDDRECRRAAVQALATAGTVLAVPALLALADRALLEGLRAASLSGPELERAARDAVRAIQSRLGPVEAGQLSVASAEQGSVSLAAEAGGLSAPAARRASHKDHA